MLLLVGIMDVRKLEDVFELFHRQLIGLLDMLPPRKLEDIAGVLYFALLHHYQL